MCGVCVCVSVSRKLTEAAAFQAYEATPILDLWMTLNGVVVTVYKISCRPISSRTMHKSNAFTAHRTASPSRSKRYSPAPVRFCLFLSVSLSFSPFPPTFFYRHQRDTITKGRQRTDSESILQHDVVTIELQYR